MRDKIKIKPKDDAALHELLKNKSRIEKTLKDLQTTTLKTNPDWFTHKGRNYKKWIDEDRAPTEKKPLTPTQALKNGYDVEENIETVVKYHTVIKNAYK